MSIDLHSHSTASDGRLLPGDVVCRAVANGATMLALTDHDETGGIDEALEAARGTGMTLIPGVEISTSFMDESVHVVGLNIDHHDQTLRAGLAGIRQGRHERAERMGRAFEEIGIHGVLEGAKRFARNPDLVGRAHFARHLVDIGVAPDVSTVFQHYLVRGKPGFVEHQWATLQEAVDWIHAAGGVAVIAHPARYRFSPLQRDALFERFIACGGEGVEVVSGSHTDEDVLRFAQVARTYGLLASCGSDFHAAGESPVDVGRCAAVPSGLSPVWSQWMPVSA